MRLWYFLNNSSFLSDILVRLTSPFAIFNSISIQLNNLIINQIKLL